VRRPVAALLFFLVIGSATGAFAAIADEEGCEDCGEQDSGCCPLVCPQCVCIARALTAVPVAGAIVPPPDVGAVVRVGEDAGAPESAESREIFHVPILAG
jgi:hypothetical protein